MSTSRLSSIRFGHIVVLAIFIFSPSFCSGQSVSLIKSGVRHAAPGRNHDLGLTLVIGRNASTSISGICISCVTPMQTISPSLTARPSLNHL
jgi:hypothetical protein